MSTLELLQKIMTCRLGVQGLEPCKCELLARLENRILHDTQLHAEAAERARIKRNIPKMPAFDPQHIQGILRLVTISKPDGSHREAWSSTDQDYARSCYILLGILSPMLKHFGNAATHGFIPGRGTNTAIRQLIATVGRFSEPYVIQTDIKNWFPTVPVAEAITMLPPKTAQTTLQIHRRFRQAIGGGTPNQGLPQGHPMAAGTATLVLDKIILDTRTRFAMEALIIAYCDDITIVSNRERTAEAVMAQMEATLGQLDVHLNKTKTHKNHPLRGNPMDYLGYLIDWTGNPRNPKIRPSAKAFRRLEEKLIASCDPINTARVIRGWSRAYSMTNDPTAWVELRALTRSIKTTQPS